jgi:hypothetical protein
MNIFQPIVEEGDEWINGVNSADYEVFLTFNGSPRKSAWNPIKVIRLLADQGKDFRTSDFPWLGSHALVMRKNAVEALHDILKTNGELLPLSTEDGVELCVLNACIIDALDVPNSSLMLIPGTDRIMRIKKVTFIASAIKNIDLFRLPHRASPTYVSEQFVERVKAAGLRGLIFKDVWTG